jgi:HEAT repeat protein
MATAVEIAVHSQGVQNLRAIVNGMHPLELRVAAAKALGRAGGADALAVLIAIVNGMNPIELREAAAYGIGEAARGK